MANDDLICPPPVPACDHPARRLALSPFHAQLSRRRRSVRGARSGCLLRNGAAMGFEVRAVVRPRTRRRRPRPTSRWHLDEIAVVIAGRQFWLWRAVDDEGEVLDLLVQRSRDNAAAVKLIDPTTVERSIQPIALNRKMRSPAPTAAEKSGPRWSELQTLRRRAASYSPTCRKSLTAISIAISTISSAGLPLGHASISLIA